MFRQLVYSSFAFALTTYSVQAAIIAPEATDNTIAFEAEIGEIDNTFSDPAIGWEIGAGTAPTSASGASWVAATEDAGSTAPRNTMSYSINFQKTGTYTVHYRVAFTTVDFQDARDAAANNDSFYYENGAIGGGTSYQERNSIPVSASSWTWNSGLSNDITVGSSGVTDWLVSNREDGFVIDRFVLVHDDETATIDAAFLDSLDNTNVVPEPGSLALGAIGLLGLVGFTRRKR
jgi:hypothetical protein